LHLVSKETERDYGSKGTISIAEPSGLVHDDETLPELEGSFACVAGVVHGWAKFSNSNLPIEIMVLVDGLCVWNGVARRHIADSGPLLSPMESAPRGSSFGFRVLLPDPIGDTVFDARTLRICADDGRDIPGSPIQIPYGDHFLGYVEVINETSTSVGVLGWSIDTRYPSLRVPLTLKYAEEIVCRSNTGINRSDLSSTGYDVPFGGFSLSIPKPPGFDYKLLQVFPGQSSIPLALTEDASLPDNQTQRESTDDLLVLSYGSDDDVIEGTIDQIDDRIVRGWARNSSNPDALVLLDLFIDGRLYATASANRLRADLAEHFKDHGHHEYRFELSPGITRSHPGKIHVIPKIGVSKLKHKFDTLPQNLKQSRLVSTRKPDVMLTYRFSGVSAPEFQPTVAIIVINRNGSALLQSLLQSFSENNSYQNYEFIIVDHDSTDDSAHVVAAWTQRINVKWLARGTNYSFSSSNNYAAEYTTAEILLFANNDITFISDILDPFLAYFAAPEVGCVGIKLLDDSPVARTDGQFAIQHLGVHIDDRNTGLALLPLETRWFPAVQCVEQLTVEVPAVTAAFMACRREEFIAVGGFSETYFYGQEDVDLCFKFAARGQKIICANDLKALHLRGFTRLKMDRRYARARERNVETLQSRFGAWIQKRLFEDRFSRPGFWTSMVPRIAFVVTEATQDTLAGDYFTALELASQLSAQFPCVTGFVEVVAKNQYDLTDFDVVIAMRDDYDPQKIKKAPPHLLKIAWVRNWFERFAERDSAKLFDLVWASSPSACTFLQQRLGRKVELVEIATNLWRFEAGKVDSKFQSDYCFTGSYWNLNREIVQMLDPQALPFKFALFGKGWEKIPHLAPFSRGSLPYARMPDVYASTRLVIDDANHVTKAWGAVNSRVFDAIAAGALVITNGKSGADTTFEGKLPTFDSPQALEDLLWLYLSDEPRRVAKVAELQEFVRRRHTYQLRARKVWQILKETSARQLRIAIKIGAPNAAVRNEWGDYHFASSMKHEFDKLGHSTRIDCLDTWKNTAAVADHVVIVLRGLSAYQPKPHQINLMWNISHPDKISDYEYSQYDHVFVASEQHTQHLKPLLGDRVSTLLQCTDPRFFNPELGVGVEKRGVLFVGNSRGELRPIVRDAIAAGLPLEVYGAGWDGMIPDVYIKGTNIPNAELGRHYAAAAVVLNDHWENMREAGFISNRVFDALACGAPVISDRVPGMEELFGEHVTAYDTVDDLRQAFEAVCGPLGDILVDRRARAVEVGTDHTFETRVRRIIEAIRVASTKICEIEGMPDAMLK
jgi:GT2 family glycosyltransferase/spore maturation protein CgeB